ncbi:MAG: hypothetical protein P0Y48_12455 [Candidatus Microbacterium phytovorans]|uniref:Uncharacterized protein n=1 Tax=Candidatus Microbacterium phytovorans TaxID=3121374 RepID=A0AAJ6B553_9MICO|nr:hypothetical protein [Microbacterium sp.]WEK15097.1 MAG: hypothetical protein P0Y48_12455 [Microbacterium sp.]
MTLSKPTPEDDEYAGMNAARGRRTRIIAWVVIVSLILVGGGSTVLALLFG